MTAEMREKASGGLFAALKRLKEQWLLIVAFASALFWARDMVEVYAGLPARLDAVEAETVLHTGRLDRLEAQARCGTGGHRRWLQLFSRPKAEPAAPALGVSGHRGMGAGRAGDVAFRSGVCDGANAAAQRPPMPDP